MNTYMNEGVGKRIVDALKKQTELEIVKQPQVQTVEDYSNVEVASEPVVENFDIQPEIQPTSFDFSQEVSNVQPVQQAFQTTQQNFVTQSMGSGMGNMNVGMGVYSQPIIGGNFADFGGLEVPTNVAILKQLISQLPSGVSRQAGALVIKQTMEALGISMKSVLQEAQQLQENINLSTRDCQNSILECKKQINTLETQVQKYQRQSAGLNDIVSLFLQVN